MFQDSMLTQLLFLFVPWGLIIYFFILAPRRKEEKKIREMQSNLKKNDEVVTTSGIHGTVVIVKDKTVVVRVDEHSRIEFDRESILRINADALKPEVVK